MGIERNYLEKTLLQEQQLPAIEWTSELRFRFLFAPIYHTSMQHGPVIPTSTSRSPCFQPHAPCHCQAQRSRSTLFRLYLQSPGLPPSVCWQNCRDLCCQWRKSFQPYHQSRQSSQRHEIDPLYLQSLAPPPSVCWQNCQDLCFRSKT